MIFAQEQTQLESNLNSTHRNYACSGEDVVFTCSGGIGPELDWDIDGRPFHFDSTSDLPEAQFSNNITAVLIRRDPTANDSQLFRFISKAVQTVSGGKTSINVSCTVQEPAARIILGISGIMCVCVAIVI